MHSFETIGEDGRLYMHYDNWTAFRERWMWENPRSENQFRFDLELVTPGDRLEQLPVDRVPHHPPTLCFYECDEWCVRLGPFDAHHPSGESLRVIVESGCRADCEQITLFSTSNTIENESWGLNKANKFVKFRGQYWYVKWHQFLQPWAPPIRYPLSCSPPRLSLVHRVIDAWLRQYDDIRIYSNGAHLRRLYGMIDLYYGGDNSPYGISFGIGMRSHYQKMAGQDKMVCRVSGNGLTLTQVVVIDLCHPKCFEALESILGEWIQKIS